MLVYKDTGLCAMFRVRVSCGSGCAGAKGLLLVVY